MVGCPHKPPALAGAYRDAYMSLSAAAVFAPYVRLELLQWDPIFTGRAGMGHTLPQCSLPASEVC